MIVFASDYVGFKVVEFLTTKNIKILHLVLDKQNSGNFNEKIIALSKHVQFEIHYNTDLNDNKFLDDLEKSTPKIGILAWWPYILKGKILSIPKFGWLNFHPSYLPYNRGKHSNFWSVVDNTTCGVSLQFIDEHIDTGDIIIQKKIDINWEDTGKSIDEKSREAIIDLFKDNYDLILQNKLPRIKQSKNEGSYHHSNEMWEICNIKLDSTYTARKLFNIIRGKMFHPYSPAFFYDGTKKYSVEIYIKEQLND